MPSENYDALEKRVRALENMFREPDLIYNKSIASDKIVDGGLVSIGEFNGTWSGFVAPFDGMAVCLNYGGHGSGEIHESIDEDIYSIPAFDSSGWWDTAASHFGPIIGYADDTSSRDNHKIFAHPSSSIIPIKKGKLYVFYNQGGRAYLYKA